MKNLSINEKVLYGLLLLLMLLAWLTVIDKIAYELNIESLKETSAAFVALKVFDSLITLAKDLPFIGNMFAPYKDFLDRMSFVMLISFLSLGLQKVILVAMQSFIVNFVLSINILVVIINGITNFLSENTARKLLKLAILMLFIRFAIPLLTFVIVSIQTETDIMSTKMHQERIELLQKKLINISKLAEEDELQKQQKENKLTNLTERLEILEKTQESLEDKQSAIRNEKRSSVDRLTSLWSETKDNEETAKNLAPTNKKLAEVKQEVTSVSKNIDELKDPAFYEVTDSLKEKINIAMANINTFVEDMFDLFMTSVILFFFTNVFFPIFFIWGLAKLIDSSFNTSFSNKLKTESHPRLESNSIN